MSDAISPVPPVPATARRGRRLPIIWLVPLVAVLIGIWLAWITISKQGPTITVSFDSAEGLQAGQSQLKFKELVLGTVKSLDLTADHSRVIATIATTRQAESLLTDQTIFWVVKPRLFAGSLSGLDTLLSGSYIGMMPPVKGGKPERTFVGREDPPILTANIPGRTFSLQARQLGSISLGSPVFFHDLSVGEVLGWEIGNRAESVTLRVFVRAPYDSYVTEDTRFWNASGVSLALGGAGVELQFESLRALLLGGIAFATPDASKAKPAAAEAKFPLFKNQEAAESASYSLKVPVISYFPGSVRGLGPGSDVTLHGLVVGHVASVRLDYDEAKDLVVAPVKYDIEPERFVGVGRRIYGNEREAMADALRHGMRASLQSANLISGQQMVVLDFDPKAPQAPLQMQGDDFVLPTTASAGLGNLTASATALLDQVNSIPFTDIGANLNGILQAANQMANGQKLQDALTDGAETLSSAKLLIGHLDTGLNPALRQLPEISSSLEKTLTSINRLALSVDSGYGDNTQVNRDLGRLLVQLNDAVRSIRALADLLARHPEVLIKGRTTEGPQ